MFELAKRILRLLRIGLTLRRLRRSHGETERQLAREAIAAQLADARGMAMKFGQLFAGDDESDPFAPLVRGVEPLPLAALLPLLDRSLGCPHGEIFAQIEPYGAAASLGQVHRALLHDGTPVAIKIRYPFIVDAVNAELKIAGLLPGMGPVRRWGIDLEAYRALLRNNMARELDYRSEAARQMAFAAGVAVRGLVVPRIHAGLCSESVLVSDWQEGGFIDTVADWPLRDRLLLAQTLLRTLFVSLFVHGEVHGDPHLGNTLYRRENDGTPLVALLDFGCTLPIERQRRLALLRLIIALREGEQLQLLSALGAAGFDLVKLNGLRAELPAICQALFTPFLVEGPFHPEQWQLSQTVRSILGERRWWFRAAGPADSMLLVRAFDGVITQLARLQVHLPWWPLLEQCVGAELLAEAHALTFADLPAEVAAEGELLLHGAKSLRVRIEQGGRIDFDATMPAAAALKLPELMPEEAIAALESMPDTDLAGTPERLKREGLKPQQLFAFDLNGRTHRIWLE